jgi:hypothetical protein
MRLFSGLVADRLSKFAIQILKEYYLLKDNPNISPVFDIRPSEEIFKMNLKEEFKAICRRLVSPALKNIPS